MDYSAAVQEAVSWSKITYSWDLLTWRELYIVRGSDPKLDEPFFSRREHLMDGDHNHQRFPQLM